MIPWLLLALAADGQPALVRVVARSGAVDGPAEIGSGAARWARVPTGGTQTIYRVVLR